jgi:HD-like signal output (HDOD) protein
MNQDLAKRIRECPTLPSLPAIALQVLELAQNEQVDLNEMARVISQDAAISSKILKTVNSSFYGRSQSIGTVSHALVLLGLQSVKTLVLGFSLVSNLKKNKSKGFDHIAYWRRSIYGATAARILCAKFQILQQEECFLAALLQDLGMLVLDQVLGEKYSDVHEKAGSHELLSATEQEALAHEFEYGQAVFASDDAKEGPKAFAEKRTPNFQRR